MNSQKNKYTPFQKLLPNVLNLVYVLHILVTTPSICPLCKGWECHPALPTVYLLLSISHSNLLILLVLYGSNLHYFLISFLTISGFQNIFQRHEA